MTEAKEIVISQWLNTRKDFRFDQHGKGIKFIHFFQMLCPGCVYYGVPQTVEVFRQFQSEGFQVYGVHSVFEHQDVMTPEALQVFIDEWKIPFPVGIDRHEPGQWMPQTMKNFQLQGTPSTVIIDGQNRLLMSHFGHFDMEHLTQFIRSAMSLEQEESL